MSKLFTILSLVSSILATKAFAFDGNLNNFKSQTSSQPVSMIGDGGGTCMTSKVDPTIESINELKANLQNSSPEEKEVIRQQLIELLNATENQ